MRLTDKISVWFWGSSYIKYQIFVIKFVGIFIKSQDFLIVEFSRINSSGEDVNQVFGSNLYKSWCNLSILISFIYVNLLSFIFISLFLFSTSFISLLTLNHFQSKKIFNLSPFLRITIHPSLVRRHPSKNPYCWEKS